MKKKKTYMHIQVAYPIIMKQNWRGGAGLRRGGVWGWKKNLRFWGTNETLVLFKRMLDAKVIKHYKVK